VSFFGVLTGLTSKKQQVLDFFGTNIRMFKPCHKPQHDKYQWQGGM